MYKCEKCRGTFEHFETPGQCPLCKVWASVRCDACGFTDAANKFIDNNDCCPKCGAKVSMSGGGSSECFVATVAFSDPNAMEVCTLREYRDLVLSRTKLGQSFIRAYYKHGPFLASIVSWSRVLKSITRAVLVVIVSYCKKSLKRRGTKKD
jgi:hypothetical protein